MQEACQVHRRLEVEKEKHDLDIMKKAGVQINEVKDIKAFQALMKPAYDSSAAGRQGVHGQGSGGGAGGGAE